MAEESKSLELVLEELLTGSYEAASLTALSDLNRDGVRSVAAIWPQLTDDVRLSVVRTAVEITEDSVLYDFKRLFRLAIDDTSAAVRQSAIAGLWEDTNSDFVPRLVDIIETDPSIDVRIEAAQSLSRYVDLIDRHGVNSDDQDRMLASLKRTAADPVANLWLRRRALESVSGIADDPEIRQMILNAFEDEDNAVKAGALYAMGRTGSVDFLDTVLGEFQNSDAELRFEAARAVGEIGDDEAVPGLAIAFGDEDLEVQMAAVQSLGRIGGPFAVRTLRNALVESEDDPALLEAIEEALDEALLTSDPLSGLN